MLRNLILDLGIDPRRYGTHCLRRGGAQYLHRERRWSIARICDWIGWSEEYSIFTVFRYLYSPHDDPVMAREDYLNPKIAPTLVCHQCGRSCHCT